MNNYTEYDKKQRRRDDHNDSGISTTEILMISSFAFTGILFSAFCVCYGGKCSGSLEESLLDA